MSCCSYRGRFAPSPTGPLHFGSLLSALGSYLQARSRGGAWLLRMEDLDRPRCMPGAADAILRALEVHGLEWDGPVWYQSERDAAYAEALEQLRAQGDAYPCACSRKEVQDAAQRQGLPGGVYPGLCRAGLPTGRPARAWRLRVPSRTLHFRDGLRGEQSQDLGREVGDFVIRRADGLFAYQLAVVVDDAAQGISEIVRGSDLLDSTPRQIYLQQRLRFPTPMYIHLPLALNTQGQKLSKQTFAPALSLRHPQAALFAALRFLGQNPPDSLRAADVSELLTWATAHWNLAKVPGTDQSVGENNGYNTAVL